MPHIHVNASGPISAQQEQMLVTEIGEAISLLPGMKPAYLMIHLDENCHLYFGGTGDCAFVEVDRFGKIPEDASRRLTARLSEIIEKILTISRDRIYVKYAESPYWGCHGNNL